MRRVLIGGDWVEPVSSVVREVHNPATLAPLGAAADCGADLAARAARAAAAAQPAWRALAAADRAERLAGVGARLRERQEPLARLLTQETGKPVCESVDELAEAASCFERAAAAAEGAAARSSAVAAVLGASDRPLLGLAAPVAAALAAGEAVVAKPAPESPLAALEFAEAFAALPPGLVNVLTGAAQTAAALLAQEQVARVVASGSRVARAAAAAAAHAAGKPVEIEADAIDALLVLDDADLELAAAGAAWAALRNAGQSGVPRVRLYVEQRAAAAFADQLHIQVAFLEVGDPSKPETDLGPLLTHEAARQAEEQVARALKDGGRLKLGGRAFRPWGLPGHFFQPTVLSEARCGGLAARGEILAPVLVAATVESAEQACRDAAAQGLRSLQVFTRDAGRAASLIAARRAAGGQARHVTARDAAWFPYRERRARAGRAG